MSYKITLYVPLVTGRRKQAHHAKPIVTTGWTGSDVESAPVIGRPSLHSASDCAPIDIDSDTVSKIPRYLSVPISAGM